ncbi:unnamed protein product [Coffea canephora]|uniref:DH200=94 genomic scaffold, scaffold_188 n=1 Tax=Coffea canephora TaxID=49390 RepID=A0A068VBF6_COFCA|nr:unnamed protein product [Coffea canephora]
MPTGSDDKPMEVCKRPSRISNHFKLPKACIKKGQANYAYTTAYSRRELSVKACSPSSSGGEKKTARRSFLSLEEAGLVEVSGLSPHERFLCRLTVSSLNLLKVIAEQEGCAIEELNAGRVCDWFLKDKLKREQNLESAVLQWAGRRNPLYIGGFPAAWGGLSPHQPPLKSVAVYRK